MSRFASSARALRTAEAAPVFPRRSKPVFIVFLVYTLFIVAGLALYLTIGITHR